MIDEQVLDRQTMGDRALAIELLDMFVAQLDAASIEMSHCSNERLMALAHSLKGTARSLGIDDVAACAADIESLPPSGDAESRLSALAARLRHEVDARRPGSG